MQPPRRANGDSVPFALASSLVGVIGENQPNFIAMLSVADYTHSIEEKSMRNSPSRILLVALMAISFVLSTTTSWAQWVQTATLTGSNGAFDDIFGFAVAVHGDTMVIGAFGDDADTGSAYVFTESNGVWSQVAELTASDAVKFISSFGSTVAVSGDTIVVATNFGCTSTVTSGAYVFVKPATGWTNMTETAKLTEANVCTDGFGFSAAISGNTIVVGAADTTVGSNNLQGAVYVYVEPAAGWTSTATPTATLTEAHGAARDLLGTALAIQGGTVVAGGASAQFTGSKAGAVYVFEEPVSGWANENETATLTVTDPNTSNSLGNAVAISNDEATIVAGAPGRVGSTSVPNGAAYIYTKPATGWQSATQTSELLAPGPAQGFGFAVAINGPGTIIAVGAPQTATKAAPQVGAAYVYRKPATGWATTPQANAKLNPPFPEKNSVFGDAVAVRATTVVVGEPFGTVNGNRNQGVAYVFDRQ
jgi:hypothetical protein